jgi:hypothetical protein
MAMSTTFAVPELGPDDLLYLERVRQAIRRLSHRETSPDDPAQALQVLRDVSRFDFEVPTASNRRELELVKTGVKRALSWYMRYVGVQLNNFSSAAARLGEVMVARSEKLERTATDLEVRVGALEERVRRLEAARPPLPVPVAQSPAPLSPQTPVPQAPVPQAPVPQAPVPQAPVPQAPVPQAPVPQAPGSQAPGLQTAAVQPPAAPASAVQEPAVQASTQEPAVQASTQAPAAHPSQPRPAPPAGPSRQGSRRNGKSNGGGRR